MKSQLTSHQNSINKTSFLLLCALCVLGGQLPAKDDPFKDLASTLGKEAPGEKVNIAVGSFNYENTDLKSPFSSMLRDELEIALGESGKFKVVTRDRLAHLRMESKFQGKAFWSPELVLKKSPSRA
jgi:hypothetical protein